MPARADSRLKRSETIQNSLKKRSRRFRLPSGRPGKRAAQHLFALLRALPCGLGAPARQDFSEVPDRDIDRCREIDPIVGGIFETIVTQPEDFGAHASLHESLRRSMAVSG